MPSDPALALLTLAASAFATPPTLREARRVEGLFSVSWDGADALAWGDRDDTWATTPDTLRDGGAVVAPRSSPVGRGDLFARGADHLFSWAGDTLTDLDDGTSVVLPRHTWSVDVQVVPDLDGDGVDDLVHPDGVWFGGAGGLREGPRWRWFPYRDWGPTVSQVGDLDGDGRPDLVRGETTDREVQVSLYLSSALTADAWPPAWTVSSPTMVALLGATVLDLGDGEPTLAVLVAQNGSLLAAAQQRLLFFRGLREASGPTLLDTTDFGGRFRVLANAGDVDGDGDDELFAGFEYLWGSEPVRPDLAASWRLFRVMEADPASGAVWTEVGPQPTVRPLSGPPLGDENFSGTSLAVTGDFDGNGVRDLAVSVAVEGDRESNLQVWLYGPELPPPPEPRETADTGAPAIEEPRDTGAPPAETDVPVASMRSSPARGCGAGSGALALLAAAGGFVRRRRAPGP